MSTTIVPVHESLPIGTVYSECSPSSVRDVTSIVPKVKLAQVAMQVLPADVVICAVAAPLEDAEVALYGVGHHLLAVCRTLHVFSGGVAYLFVRLLPDEVVDHRFIGVQGDSAFDVDS